MWERIEILFRGVGGQFDFDAEWRAMGTAEAGSVTDAAIQEEMKSATQWIERVAANLAS
jgi:hypothetical protein